MKLILEQRYLFDGSVAAVGHHAHHDPQHASDHSTAGHQDGDHSVAETAAAPALSHAETAPDAGRAALPLAEPAARSTVDTVLIVDPRVADWQSLAAGVKPTTEVVVLDPAKDGVSQVTQALQGLQGVRNLEFLTDGTPGAITLGGSTLDAAALTVRANEIMGWSAHLSARADIVFWGCDVGQGSAGATFVSDMHTLTGATIGASAEPVGSAALGGAWNLDVTTGALHRDAAPFSAQAMASYTGILDTPAPTVTMTVGGTLPHEAAGTVLLGDSVNVNMTFSNAAQAATGYGPFVELFAPSALTLNASQYNGANLTTLSAAVDPAGHFTNPLTQQVETAPNGITSGSVYVIELPYGSFTPNEPAVTINASFSMSNAASLVGQSLPIDARAGFRYGADATGGQPPIIGNAVAQSEQVTLIESWLDVSTMYGEGETATGPDFPVSYTLNLEPAPAVAASGVPITNVNLSFDLPSGIVETGTPVASGGGTASVTTAAVAGGVKQTMSVNYASLSGLQTVTFGAYVPQYYQDTINNATPTPILDPATGAEVPISVSPPYQLSADAWNGVTIQNVPGDMSGATFEAKSLAVQLVADTASALPSQDITYTERFEVSDYFGVTALNLNATLSDGLTFDPGTAPKLTVAGRNGGVSGSADFTLNAASETTGAYNNETVQTGGNGADFAYAFTPPGSSSGAGTTALTFDVGSRLPGQFGAGTVGSVTFKATVLDAYTTETDQVAGAGGFLRETDSVSASSAGNTAALQDYTGSSYAGTGSRISDDTATPVDALPTGNLSLQVVEVNGVPYTGQLITPGEQVVYELTYTLSAPGDFANLNLAAYLPEPVFSVLHPSTPDQTTAADWSGASTNTFTSMGVNASLATLAPGTYTYSTSANLTGVAVTDGIGSEPSNSVTFSVVRQPNLAYDNVATDSGASRTVTIDFAVAASSLPFVDGLNLTAQGDSSYTPAQAGVVTFQRTASVNLAEPLLTGVQQGVVSVVDDAGNDISHSAGITWTQVDPTTGATSPGSAPTIFGTAGGGSVFANGASVPSSLVAAQDNMNVAGLQAGDTARLVDAVQNTGHYAAYDVILKDALPQGLSTSNVSNLTFTRGDGTVLTPIDPTTGAAFGSTSALLASYFGTNGVLLTVGGDHSQAVLAATGSQADIVYATYDVTLPNNTPTAGSLTGQASIVAWTNRDVFTSNGSGYTLNDPATGNDVNFAGNGTLGGSLTDTATIQTLAPSVTDTITGASDLSDASLISGNGLPTNSFDTHSVTVVPGETVNLSATISLPQGENGNVTLTDLVPNGLTLVTTPGTWHVVATSQDGTTQDVTNLATVSGNTVSLAGINALVNPATGGDRPVTLTVTYQALVPRTQGTAIDTSGWGTNATAGNRTITDSWAATAEGLSYQTTTATDTTTTTGTGSASGQANAVTVTNPLVTAAITETGGTLGQHVWSGEVVTYQLTLTNNSSSATAYDLGTGIQLPAGMTYVPNSLAYVSGATPLQVTQGNIGAEGVAGAGNVLDGLTLSPGQTVVYTFQGQVDDNLPAKTVLTVKATPAWESLPASATFDGAGNVNPQAQAYDGAPGQVSNSVAPLTPDLSIIGESNQTDTTLHASSFDPTGRTTGTAVNVTDGEIVRMRAVLQLPEGQNTADMVVTLPNGLTYANDGSATVALLSPNGDTTTSLTGANLQIATGATSVNLNRLDLGIGSGDPVVTPLTGGVTASGQTVTFNFGQLANNDHTGLPNYVVVEFNTLVSNTAPAQTGVSTAMHGDANSAATSTVSDYVNIQAPNVALTKQITGITYNNDGSVTVSYTDTATNNGNAPAYNLVLDDPGAGTGVVTYVGASGPSAPSSAGVNGTHLDATLTSLGAGQSETLRYTVTIPSNQVNAAVTDATAQATLTSYALNPAQETAGQETLAGTSHAPYQSSTNATAGLDLVSGTVSQDLSATQGTDNPLLPLSGQTVTVTFSGQTGTEQVTTDASGNYTVLAPDNSGSVHITVSTTTPPAPAQDVLDNASALAAGVPSGSVSGTNPATLTFTPAASTNYGNVDFDFWRAADTAPVLANGPSGAFYATAGSAVTPFASATVSDVQLDGSFSHDYSGTTLTVQRYVGGSAAPDATDVFTGSGTATTGVWLSGGAVKLNGATVGSYTETGGKLSIQFASTGVTDATVNSVLQGISYISTAGGNATLPAIVIGVQIDDANNDPVVLSPGSALPGGPHDQGVGGDLLSNVLTATVNVSPIAPQLSIIGESNATAGLGKQFDPTGQTPASSVAATDSEIVRMRAVVQLPEGYNANSDIVVTLPNNLVFQKDGSTDVLLVSPNGNAVTSLGGAQLASATPDLTKLNLGSGADPVVTALPLGQITQNGQVVTFNLGNITFANTTPGANYAIVEFNAVVADNTAGGTSLVSLMKGDSNGVATAPALDYVTVAAPLVTLTKQVTNIAYNPDGSATVTYLDTEHNWGNGPAYGLQLDDPGAGPGTSVTYGGASGPGAVTSAGPSGSHFDSTVASLGAGQTQTFTYSVTIPANQIAQAASDSTAQATLTSSTLNPAQEVAGQESLAGTTLTPPVQSTNAAAGLDVVSGTVNQDATWIQGAGAPLVPLANQTISVTFTGQTGQETTMTDASGNFAVLVPSAGTTVHLTVTAATPDAPQNDTIDNAAALANSVPGGVVNGVNPVTLTFTTAPDTNYAPVVADFWRPIDTAPVLASGPSSPTPLQNGVASLIFPNATVADSELDNDFNHDFSGTTLTIQRYVGNTPSPDATDQFVGSGSLALAGGAVKWNNVQVGSFTETNGVLTIQFAGAGVTGTMVQNVLRNIDYVSNLPGNVLVPAVTIGAQIDDANNDPVPLYGYGTDPAGPHDQGPGGDLLSNVLVATFNVNAAPGSATFVEPNDANPGNAAVAVEPDIDLNDILNTAGTPTRATMTITGARPEDVLSFVNTADITGSYSSGVLTLTPVNGHTPSIAEWQAAIRSVTYYDTSDTPDPGTRQVVLQLDSGGTSATHTSDIAISPTDDSPILDTTRPVSLTDSTEYQGTGTPMPGPSDGMTVAQLVGLNGQGPQNVADPDGAGLTNGAAPTAPGIAITGYSTTDAGGQSVGAWYYSTDNGAHWTAFPTTISDQHPLDLAPDARIAFQPTATNFNGQIPDAITFRAWDRFDGTANGTQANLAGVTLFGQQAADNSAATAYSIAKDTLPLMVDNVNNAPFAAGDVTLPSVSTAEQHPPGQTVSQLFAQGFSDPLDQQYAASANPLGSTSNTFAGIAVTGNAATAKQGVWEYSLDGGKSWTAIGADVSAQNAVILPAGARLAFQPMNGFSGYPGKLTVNLIDSSATQIAPGLTGQDLAGEGLGGVPLAARTGVDLPGLGGSNAISAGSMTLGTLIQPLPPNIPSHADPAPGPQESGFPDDNRQEPSGIQHWTTDDYLQRPLIPDLSLVGSVADRFIIEAQHAVISVPQNIFVDSLPDAQLTYEAKLPDGSALPSWLTFNPNNLTFTGTPPRGSHGRLEVLIRARDVAGNTADANFNILIGREQQDLLGLLQPNRHRIFMPRLTVNPFEGLKAAIAHWPGRDRHAAAPGPRVRDGVAPAVPREAAAPQPDPRVREGVAPAALPGRGAGEHAASVPAHLAERAALLADLPPVPAHGGFSAALHAAGPLSALGRARAWLDAVNAIDPPAI